MKEQGYTFIDLGNPAGILVPSAFYNLEKN